MAVSKDKKHQVVAELGELLASSKLTVVAAYPGTTVKAMQTLRYQARANGTVVKVIKNRLVKKALEANETFKAIDSSALTGQLLYAFNAQDETAAAQTLAKFAKTEPTIQFVGGFSMSGEFMGAEDISALADLPSKEQLIAGVINTLGSPVRGVMSSLSGNLHGLLQALEANAN